MPVKSTLDALQTTDSETRILQVLLLSLYTLVLLLNCYFLNPVANTAAIYIRWFLKE